MSLQKLLKWLKKNCIKTLLKSMKLVSWLKLRKIKHNCFEWLLEYFETYTLILVQKTLYVGSIQIFGEVLPPLLGCTSKIINKFIVVLESRWGGASSL